MSIRTIAANGAWLGLVQILNFAIPMLTLPVIARAFGPETYGFIASVSATAGYAGLLITFGFHLTGPRLIARSEADPLSLSEAFSKIFLGQIGLTAATFAIGSLIIVLTSRSRFEGATAMLILAGTVFTAILPMWMFVGLQRVRDIALGQFLLRVSAAALTVSLIRHEADALVYVLINSTASVLGCAWALVILKRRGIRLRWTALDQVLAALRSAGRLFLSSVAINAYTSTNLVIVGFLLGPAAAGYFALADRVRGAMVSLFDPVSQSLYPYLCRPGGTSGNEKQIFFVALTLLSAASSMALYVASPLIADFLGSQRFASSVVPLRILSVTPFLICLSNILGIQTMLPDNMERELSRIVTGAGVAGIPIALLLTHLAGIEGTAWSYVAVEAGVTIAMAVCVARKRSLVGLFLPVRSAAS